MSALYQPVLAATSFTLETSRTYAGMSRTNMRKRIWAHATGRGSKMIRQMLADGHAMYLEYCAIDVETPAASARDIARTEFAFMLLHTGRPLPGNVKLDGLSLFPDPTLPKAGSLQGESLVTPFREGHDRRGNTV